MQHTLAYQITLLHRSFLSYTGQQLRSLGLNLGSLPFILYLGKHPGCSPSQLTAALHMDWGHSQRTLTRLEEGHFLTREKVGRSYRLELTEAGQHAFSVSHQVFTDWDRAMLGALSPEQQGQLLSLAEKVTAACKDERHV